MIGDIGFRALAALCRRPARKNGAACFAVSQIRRPTADYRLTVASLVVAIGMASGMAVMIHSFDRTMRRWIETTLTADLFVSCVGAAGVSSRNRIREATWRLLAEDTAVDTLSVVQVHPIRYAGRPTTLVGEDGGRHERAPGYMWVQPPDGEAILAPPVAADSAIPAFVSESFCVRYRVARGDAVEIPTPAGTKTLAVTGVFADYGNERGAVVVSRELLSEWYDDNSAVKIAVYLKSGEDPEAVRQRWLGRFNGITVRSHARLRDEILTIFRQTFSITYVLEGIGVIVALTGLVMALVELQLGRRAQLSTLRELGMSRREIASAAGFEGLAIALVGLTLGMIVSLAIGHVLIYVINKQSFGWTLLYHVPWRDLAVFAAVLVSAAGAASYLVGLWSASLRSEQEE